MKDKIGTVCLVGAGPGDEELITLRGSRILAEAEVLLYDRLASPRLLSRAPSGCEKIFVGKREENHSVSQEEINALLVRKAKEGKRVVRLKGGDSFVFGRGGEEILALEAEKIPYQVVPGITSAIAALEAAGIPVTNRMEARSFHVITGHTAPENENAPENEKERFLQYGKLEGTLIFLMGVGNLPEIVRQLLKGGKSPDTPAAIVEQGTCIRQRRIDGVLGNIVEKAEEWGVKPPAVLAVGQTAACHMVSENLPLSGRRIGVTGTAAITGKLEKGLKDMGALVYSAPYLKIMPTETLKKRRPDWKSFSWLVFTSANGVNQFFRQIKEMNLDIRALSHLKYAVVGRGTADALWQYGIRADYMPLRYTVEELAKGLAKELLKEDRVLVLRAKEASGDIHEIWREQGVIYEDLGIYETAVEEDMAEQLWQQIDILDTITFASASGVKAFFSAGRNRSKGEGRIYGQKERISLPAAMICIGQKTEETLKEYVPAALWGRIKTAAEYTVSGLIQACTETMPAKSKAAVNGVNSNIQPEMEQQAERRRRKEKQKA